MYTQKDSKKIVTIAICMVLSQFNQRYVTVFLNSFFNRLNGRLQITFGVQFQDLIALEIKDDSNFLVEEREFLVKYR